MQRQRIDNVVAVLTRFRTGEKRVYLYKGPAIPLGLIGQLPDQLTPTGI